ncbi:AEC family transporter [Rhodoplanes sp. TEM]|uniref:AEC family transporter n=1 Tax=Rhodoplanes tepidamans TaxID=200616 RepID=A0ABT5JAN0_RHOTP|nr:MULTISPECIES: AEC family transporter [Rhodoplanes]MDC7786441.1 AEC family transporter [Rhodoplanes tepidamans]MDC7985083.1 AEC family transporter [Rhodoplanes sp. TEM]MDQ0357326.1 putative permease [Rhodoplanes tepidamans]
MIDVLNLALPFFGLIFLGMGCGRFARIPDAGLAWMDFFVIYVALPSLFFRVLSETPADQLGQVSFILGTTLATFAAFLISFGVATLLRRGLREATIIGLAGSFGNVGYMGPGLAVSALGTEAAAPVALIFCFDTLLVFSLAPFLMALSRGGGAGALATLRLVLRRIALHPFIIASVLGVAAAALEVRPPVALDRLLQFLQNAAAPCALFALGVTVAMRPVDAVSAEMPIAIVVKLLVHPLIVLAILSLLGPFAETWVYTAVLLAALPTALSIFVLARQYDTWVAEASSLVMYGIVVSVFTVTAVLWLIKTHRVPVSFWG